MRCRTSTAAGEILTADGQIVAESRPPPATSSTCASTRRRRAVRARRRLPVVRPGGQHRRRGVVQQGAHRPGHAACSSRTSATSSAARPTPTTSCSRSAESAQTGCARDALGDQQGSVVVLDVKTGAVLAMYSNPTFDPNRLVGHDTQFVQNYVQPPQQRARQAARCSVRTASATHRARRSRWSRPVGARRPAPRRRTPSSDVTDGFQIPRDRHQLSELRRRVCGGTLDGEPHRVVQHDVRRSSATRWATRSCPRMDQCGIDSAPPIDLTPLGGARASVRGSGEDKAASSPSPASARATCSRPRCRWRSSPTAVANNGVIMEPHVVKEIRNSEGKVVRTIEPKPLEDVHAAGDRGRRSRA